MNFTPAGDMLFWLLVFLAALLVKVILLPGRLPRRRGFEVKLTTGPAPVLREEKDQNHG